MSKQSSRSTSPRSANSGMARSKAATPKPASTAKTTYESILDCQNRIFEVIDNFDRIEAMDNGLGIGRVEKPDDSAYVLHYNEQELVQLSESIGKMTFADADFGVDEDSSAVEQALLESNLMIESMMSHKEDEMKKIKELVEKFRQLRRDQELQLGNTIREIKVSKGYCCWLLF